MQKFQKLFIQNLAKNKEKDIFHVFFTLSTSEHYKILEIRKSITKFQKYESLVGTQVHVFNDPILLLLPLTMFGSKNNGSEHTIPFSLVPLSHMNGQSRTMQIYEQRIAGNISNERMAVFLMRIFIFMISWLTFYEHSRVLLMTIYVQEV